MEKRVQEVEIRKKGKKLDWIIYILAFVALALMIVVIVSNNRTEIEVTDLKPIISKEMVEKPTSTEEIGSEAKEFEPKVVEPEKVIVEKEGEKLKEEEIEKEKEAEVESKIKHPIQKTQETKTQETTQQIESKREEVKPKKIETKEVEKVRGRKISYRNYNWKALKRYRIKPDKGLYIVSKYVVKKGDALWKIAKKMGVKTINIIAVNSISNPDLIFPGQTILIPNM